MVSETGSINQHIAQSDSDTSRQQYKEATASLAALTLDRDGVGKQLAEAKAEAAAAQEKYEAEIDSLKVGGVAVSMYRFNGVVGRIYVWSPLQPVTERGLAFCRAATPDIRLVTAVALSYIWPVGVIFSALSLRLP